MISAVLSISWSEWRSENKTSSSGLDIGIETEFDVFQEGVVLLIQTAGNSNGHISTIVIAFGTSSIGYFVREVVVLVQSETDVSLKRSVGRDLKFARARITRFDRRSPITNKVDIGCGCWNLEN